MKKLDLNEIKMVELDILREVTAFCDKNNIIYYLTGGTLLGAIRHKGFIPWDDDIDIMMPRPDYIKFIKEYNKWDKKNYNITSVYNDKNTLIPYAKVCDTKTRKIERNIDYSDKFIRGIDVDIFPLDGLPNSYNNAKNFIILQQILNKIYVLLLTKYERHKNKLINIFKFSIYIFLKALKTLNVINVYKITKIINSNSAKYDFYSSKFVAVSVFPHYGQNEIALSYNFKKRIKVKFETDYFYVPLGYDEYLKGVYGNYMKLPPKSKRKTHHVSNSYWID